MGVGDSLEATYPLRAAVPAGNWGLIGDGIVAGDGVSRVEVSFEILRRSRGAMSGGGELIVRFVHTFLRDANDRFSAVRYQDRAPTTATAAADDLLVLRITALGGDPLAFYILNGDGERTGGRIPRIDLPPLPL